MNRWGTGAFALVCELVRLCRSRPSRSAKCRGCRLGSALVDSAVGRSSACDSPVGGRPGMASGAARLNRPSGARARVGPG